MKQLVLLPTGSGIAAGSQHGELVARAGELLLLPGLAGTAACSIQLTPAGFQCFLTSRKEVLFLMPAGQTEARQLVRGVGVGVAAGDELLWAPQGATECPEDPVVAFLVTEVDAPAAQVRHSCGKRAGRCKCMCRGRWWYRQHLAFLQPPPPAPLALRCG